jgi:hypothetical protein
MSLLLNDLILNSFHKNNKSSIFDLSNYLNENQCKTQRIIESYIKSTNKNENNNNLNNINSYRKKLLIDNITNNKSLIHNKNNNNNNNEINNNKRRLNSEQLKILNNNYLSDSQKKNFNKLYNLISFKTINNDISRNKKENSFFHKNFKENNDKFLYHTDKLAKKRIDLKNSIFKNSNIKNNFKEQYYKGNKIYEKLNKRFGYEYDEHIKNKVFFKERKENKEYLNKKNNINSVFNETYNLNDKFDTAINDYINIIKSTLSRNQSREKIKNINLNLENSLKDEKKRAFSSRNKNNFLEKDSYINFNNINIKTNDSQFSNKLKKEEEINQFKREFDEKII